MPKKTKKEKALAQARRLIQNANLHQSTHSLHQQTHHQEVSVPTFEFKAKQTPIAQPVIDTSDAQEFTAIRKDILKTVILASVALIFEYIVSVKFGT